MTKKKWLGLTLTIKNSIINGNINMKVVILCGGIGSRLAEETKLIPKPMVKIGPFPIVQHIIN